MKIGEKVLVQMILRTSDITVDIIMTITVVTTRIVMTIIIVNMRTIEALETTEITNHTTISGDALIDIVEKYIILYC